MVATETQQQILSQFEMTWQEQERAASNGFVRFVIANKQIFGDFVTSHHQLRGFRQNWEQSERVNQLAEELLYTSEVVFTGGKGLPAAQLDARKKRIKDNMITNLLESSELSVQTGRAFQYKYEQLRRKLSPQQFREFRECVDRINALEDEVKQAHEPFIEREQETRQKAISTFRSYIIEDPSALPDIADFMKDQRPHFGILRQTLRPVLAEVAKTELSSDKQQKLLDTARDTRVNQLKERTTSKIVADFSSYIIHHGKIMQWLQFALNANGNTYADPGYPTDEELANDVSRLLERIPFLPVWPDELKNAYNGFVFKKYDDLVKTIRDHLRQFQGSEQKFRPEGEIFQPKQADGKNAAAEVTAHVLAIDDLAEQVLPQDLNKAVDEMLVVPDPITAEDWKRLPFPVVKAQPQKGGRIVYEPFDLQKYVAGKGGRDPLKQRDIEVDLYLALSNPKALDGTHQLKDKKIPVTNYRQLPLRAFKPDDFPGLVLNTREGRRYRVVFAVDEETTPPTIVFEEVIHHEQFTKKYGGRK